MTTIADTLLAAVAPAKIYELEFATACFASGAIVHPPAKDAPIPVLNNAPAFANAPESGILIAC